jgi:hypothetical protein
LSEALGTVVAHQTVPLDEGWSETINPTRTSLTSQGDPASASSSVISTLPEAVLDLGSTTITATQYPSGTLQVGSQITHNDSPTIIVIDSHTLSTKSNAIILDSTTATFAIPTPTVQRPTILTLDSTLLTAHQASSSSGAIEIGSHTLVPGSSALVTEGHTVSAAASGLMQDGSLVAPLINSTVATSSQSLPSVQAGYGSELPSVVSGPTFEGGGGEAPASSGEASSGTDLSSSTDRLRQVPGMSWIGAAAFIFAYVW